MFNPLKVVTLSQGTPSSLSIGLEIPHDLQKKFIFKPGQFVLVQFKLFEENLLRSYSITSLPGDDVLTITVKKITDGCISSHIHDNLKLGDCLNISAPRGLFHNHKIESQKAQKHIYFASGSGITPIFSMIKSIISLEPDSQVKLFYGNKKVSDAIFFEQLNDLKDLHLSRLEILHFFSRQKRYLDLFNGRIDGDHVKKLIEKNLISPQTPANYYICGPDTMVEDIKAVLCEAGVEGTHIFSEAFIAQKLPAKLSNKTPKLIVEPSADSDGQMQVELKIHGTQEMIMLTPENHNLIDAALEQGVKLPFSCRGGMCSTCRCKLLHGDLLMKDNYSLEPWELEKGFILACQVNLGAISKDSDKITLDFDAH